MSRGYDPQSVVQLPFFIAAVGATLGRALVAAAHGEKKLAENVRRSVALLEPAASELQAELGSSIVPPLAEEALTGDVGAALSPEREEARAWSGCMDWLEALGRMALSPRSTALAAQLHKALFPSGVAFVRKEASERWTETQSRIDHIKEEELDADFAAIGGTEVLGLLRTSHDLVGVALGITAPASPAAPSPRIQKKLDALRAGVRCHILQVVANLALDPTEAGAALAARLLAPLIAYDPPARAKPKSAKKKDEPAQTTVPAQTTAPAQTTTDHPPATPAASQSSK